MTKGNNFEADEPESIINDFIDENDVIVLKLGMIQPANVVRTAEQRLQSRASHRACRKLTNGIFLYERPHEYSYTHVYRRVHDYAKAREYRQLHTYPPSKFVKKVDQKPVVHAAASPSLDAKPLPKQASKATGVQTIPPVTVSSVPMHTQTSPIPPLSKQALKSAAVQTMPPASNSAVPMHTQTSPIPPPTAVPVVVPVVSRPAAVALTDAATSPIPTIEPREAAATMVGTRNREPETKKEVPVPSPPPPQPQTAAVSSAMPPVEERHPRQHSPVVDPVRQRRRSSSLDMPIAVVAVAMAADTGRRKTSPPPTSLPAVTEAPVAAAAAVPASEQVFSQVVHATWLRGLLCNTCVL